MNLSEALYVLATRYTYERAKPFSGSKFGDFVRHELAKIANMEIPYGFEDFTLKSSVGAGNWASVPWLAFFDPLVTSTAQEGIYVVYLVNPDTQVTYLSLNQGTTSVYKEFGQTRGRAVLQRRADDMRARIFDIAKKFPLHSIDLGSSDSLPLGYMAGHCIGKAYTPDELSATVITEDLHRILSIYRRLINRGGSTPSDVMLEDAQTLDIMEARRYTLSRRIERAPKVRELVLKSKAPICEGCGLEPSFDYSFKGPLYRIPLDVHHIAPLNELDEGEKKRYRVPQDFYLLCPTCHRAIHAQQDVGDLSTLRSSIRFKHLREIV